MFKGSWKTTSAAIAVLLASIGAAITAFQAGDAINFESVFEAAMGAGVAFGLWAARDNGVSSEEVGAKPAKQFGKGLGSSTAVFLAIAIATPAVMARDVSVSGLGSVSIGTNAAGSAGDVNVPLRSVAHTSTFQDVVNALTPIGGGTIRVLPGDYFFDSAVVISSRIRIEMDPGAVLYPRGSGAVGLFDVQESSRFELVGGNVIADTWVASQELVKVKSAITALIEDVRFTMTTTDGLVVVGGGPDTHSTTPMRFISFDDCGLKWVRDCVFVPNYGCTPVYAKYGQHLTVSGCDFGSFDNREIVDVSNHVQAHMRYGIYLLHDGWARIEGNTFESIGGSTTFYPTTDGPAVIAVILYQNETGLGPQLNEGGHLTVHNNNIEDVLASSMVVCRGLRWGTITSNRFDNTNDEINAVTEAVIVLEAEDGASTGQDSHDIVVANNHSHNPVTGTGSRNGHFLLARSVLRCSVIGNAVKVFRGIYCIRIHPDDCADFLANGNTFDSGSLSGAPQATAAYYIESGTAPRYSIANEVCSGMSSGVIDKGTVTGGVQNETNLVSI